VPRDILGTRAVGSSVLDQGFNRLPCYSSDGISRRDVLTLDLLTYLVLSLFKTIQKLRPGTRSDGGRQKVAVWVSFIYIHTYIHNIYMHTYIRAYVSTYIHRIYTHTYVHTYIHTNI
jgi:hypothetical protein